MMFFDDNFSYPGMATLVVRHDNFLFGWQVSVFFWVSFFSDGNFCCINVRAVLPRATHVARIIWVQNSIFHGAKNFDFFL